MKTATVTWITHQNYGTDLQAYALQRYLIDNGFENTIISDKYIICPYLLSQEKNGEKKADKIESGNQNISKSVFERTKRYILNPKSFFEDYRTHREYRKAVKRNAISASYRECMTLIEDFKKRRLVISESYSQNDMSKHNDQFDAFICGSDQIWSVFDINFKGYFYLDFVTKKKIAYSPSIGTDIISDEKKKKIKEYLKDYSAISVRENISATQLSELCNRSVYWVCDPTLLHTKEFWSNFSSNEEIKEKKYILCYFLGENDWYFSYVKSLAKTLRLKPLMIPIRESFAFHKWSCGYGVSPEKFVALIKNAAFVVTDSYHAMIFSMIFEKKFLYLKRFKDNDEISQNIRVNSLLEKVNMKHLCIPEKEFQKQDIKDIDYDVIGSILCEFRKQSQEFLNKSLRERADL